MQQLIDKPEAFFITGTGRCGTMLLSRLFNLSSKMVCKHEEYFKHQSMLDYYTRGEINGFIKDIQESFEPSRIHHQTNKITLGVSSGHLYFSIPLLWKMYGEKSRYIFLVRRPDNFVRSAMARGFFDPEHPNYCNQIQPKASDPIAMDWSRISVLERNLWYWSMVNSYLLELCDLLPRHTWRLVKIEDLNTEIAYDLCLFLGITDIDKIKINNLLKQRINASPGHEDNTCVNPYSLSISMPIFSEWNNHDQELLNYYTAPLINRLYPAINNNTC